MASYIRSDLDFILAQIKIAEANAAGRPLYGNGTDGLAGTADDGLIPNYLLSWGLRTVDGSYNNLLPGQEYWGSSNQPFVELLAPDYRPADGTLFDPDGPGPAPAIPTSPNYNPSNDPGSLVFDASLRTISNLIVDQSLGNPAAVLKALAAGGVVPSDLTNLGLVLAIHNTFQPFANANFQAGVAATNAHNALVKAEAALALDPLNQVLIDARDAAIVTDTNAAATSATAAADLLVARGARDAQLPAFGIEMDGDNVQILNVATDGVSAPFNSWFTLFGQFFDHGLDLVNKGGSGTVFVPLQPDDPLYVVGSHTNFMVLTRATTTPGADGVMGTPDDVRPVNTTTPFVDQNQTYTSHPSHQVFLRQYVLNGEGKPVATGNLIEGLDATGGTTGAGHGGMATWGEVKAQTLQMLGIQLVDQDVGKVPLLRTDAYGNFIPDPVTGFAQVVIGLGADGIPNTADDIVVSGTPSNPVVLATATNGTLTGAIRTNSAFLADIAHSAVPNGIEDGDITIGLSNPGNNPGVYDNELLDAHFIAGDGRANENIGLTAVHAIFHSEHNRMAAHTKDVVLADAAAMLAAGATEAEAVAFLNEWLTTDVAAVPVGQAAIDGLIWDGNRIFQAAKFGTEMQYQHLVFEDFARKIQPNIDFFVVPDGYHADINPSITAEFAHVVYRFGHSMLNEQIDRFDTTFTNDQIGLVEAFLNPVAFDAGHTVNDNIAAGDIIRGMTRQVGNEIDEFVTGALRNNLLGLPLDLATINLARGRDTGVPSLNAARREFYEASSQAPELKPYDSWVEFAANLKNEASIINFVAAYGTHSSIVNATTIEGKRDAAMAMIFNQTFGSATVPADAADFLNGTGAWANVGGITTTGLDIVDLWIGGLAEKTMVGGGLLGATFNFVFEVQLEKLQDGDRFYYLQRLDGLHFLAEMENNTFAKVIGLNSNADHLPSDVFSAPGLILEVNQARQYNDLNGDGIMEQVDPTGGSILTPLVIRNNPATPGTDSNYLKYTGAEHVLLGGTDGNDIIISSEGDDTLYGDAGNDRLEGGQGNDQYIGGAGDDIIVDLFGDDIIRSGSGNDAINAGVGTDLIIADEGNDFIVLGSDVLDEAFGGLGNDFIMGSKTTEQSMGGEGDDWIEVGAWTGAVGDNFDDVFRADAVKGHDVFSGDGGFDEFVGEGGDDIWNGTLGRGKFDGNSGFDWATYKDFKFGVDVDLNRVPFDVSIVIPPNASIDTFTYVEGVSGSKFNDQLSGSDFTDLTDTAQGGARGSVLEAEGIALIAGLQDVVGAGVSSHSTGDILLGGAGSDIITGRGGNDIIDGDKWLNVRIGVHAGIGVDGGVGAEIDSANSMSELVTEIFNGTYNPGQLRIHREILDSGGVGDIDTAVFSGNFADYTISVNPDFSLRVAHTGGTQADGIDTLSNIEQLRFADGTHLATEFLNVTPVITSNGGGVAAAISMAENTSIATAVATVTATDGNNTVGNPLNPQTLTYSISGGADAARFSISATTGVLSFVASPNFEIPTDAGSNNVYDVIVQVSDNLGATDTQALAVTVTNVNEAPVITSVAAFNVAENSTAVGTVTATDVDVPSTLTYSMAGGTDAALFAINATTGALSFITAPDFEAPIGGDNVYNVDVQVSDGLGGTAIQAVTVTVTNVNEAPVITSNLGGATADIHIAENGTAVTTVVATDVDAGATPAYTIGGVDAGFFSINSLSGELIFSPPPDFENLAHSNIYNVTVIATDAGGLSDSQDLTVTVTNVNEAPVITSVAAFNVAENSTAVGTVTATDVDAGATQAYTITGGADAALFAINATTGALSFVNAPDFEGAHGNLYDVIVEVSDGLGGVASQTLAVTVTNVNEAPVITSAAAFNVAENSTAVGTVIATDVDAGAALTYAIVGGDDETKFAINAGSGLLSFIAPPDFETPTDAGGNNVYNLIVEVSDGLGGTATQAIAVAVTNVAENIAPVITSNGGGAVADPIAISENTTAVTTVVATDANNGSGDLFDPQTLTYSIVGGADAALFSINAAGVLSFVAAPNFEAPADAGGNNVYDVTVQVSDGLAIDTQAISVTVQDVAENLAPTNISWNGVVPSNTALPGAGVVIANLSTVDPDLGDTFTYTLEAGSSAGFAVSAAGVVTRTGAAMANNTTYTLNFRTTDAAGASLVETFNIRTNGGGNTNFAAYATSADDIMYGMQGSDTLVGNNGDDTLFGQAGNDTLNGGAGNDNLNGGTGNDTVNGDAGNDIINYVINDGNDVVNGGNDSDTLNIAGTIGADSLDVVFNGTSIVQFEGGTVTNVESIIANMLGGVDTLDYNGTTAAVNVNLATGSASGFTSIASFESARGGSGNDTLTGNTLANNLEGGNGNDSLIATVDNVRDNFGGNGGTDTADYSVYTANLAVVLDGLVGGSGSNIANSDVLSGIENFISGSGSDSITGNGSNNVITGGVGNDVIAGAGGADVLTGGADADTFDYNAIGESGIGVAARDLITDFVSGVDKLDFSTIDARTGFGVNAGNNAFVFNDIAGAAITGRGQLVYHYEGSGATAVTVIQGNVNAGLGADFEVALTGHIVFNQATDLVL